MQARNPLMIEHRLIENMLHHLKHELDQVEKTKSIDPYLVDKAVDFIRVYADRTHHGKEEDILFRRLQKKKLTDIDRQAMEELVEEHVFSRKTTKALIQANERYRKGDSSALDEIKTCLKTLIDFYPKHIQKEDKVFFPATRIYFSDEEDKAMLAAFWEFDRMIIHEKYGAVVKEFALKGRQESKV
jgi:hemerythrin-like domain-containing protein